MRSRDHQAGFTLIELLVVVVVVGVLATPAVPNFLRAMDDTRVSRTAADLKTFGTAFLDFASDEGVFPPDSQLEAPSHLANGVGIEGQVPVNAWIAEAPLGGNYDREGPDSHPHAGICLHATGVYPEEARRLHEILGDGDLSTGAFRETANGRDPSIIDEQLRRAPARSRAA